MDKLYGDFYDIPLHERSFLKQEETNEDSEEESEDMDFRITQDITNSYKEYDTSDISEGNVVEGRTRGDSLKIKENHQIGSVLLVSMIEEVHDPATFKQAWHHTDQQEREGWRLAIKK